MAGRDAIHRNWTEERPIVGSQTGGIAAAIGYTQIETAKLNGVDPQAWLAGLRYAPQIAKLTVSTICSVETIPLKMGRLLGVEH